MRLDWRYFWVVMVGLLLVWAQVLNFIIGMMRRTVAG